MTATPATVIGPLATRPHPWRMRMESVDPLSAAAARPLTVVIAVSMVVLAILDSVTKADQVTSLAFLVVTFVILVTAMIFLVDRTRLSRPGWSRASALVLHGLLVLLMISAALATWGGNVAVRDDWAPLVVALTLFALTSYRSPAELAIWTGVHTGVAAVLGLLQSPFAQTPLPAPLSAISGSVVILIIGSAAVGYARSMNGSVLSWEKRAWRRAESFAREARGGVARSVRQQQISRAGRDAMPVLDRVVERGEVTTADRDEAAERAASIRRTLVDAVQRSWSRELVDELIARRPELAPTVTIEDPADAGRAGTLEERTLIRAMLSAVMDAVGTVRIDLAIAPPAAGRGLSVRITAVSERPAEEVRDDLAPLIAAVRGLARRCVAVERDGALVLEFEYGH